MTTTRTIGPEPVTTARERAAAAEQAAARATQEHRDARDLVDALQHRVEKGDQDVTAEQIAAQKALADFAELRATAAARAAEQARHDLRQARLAELAADIAAHSSDADQLDQALTDLETAIGRLCDLTVARRHAVAAYRDRMQALGVPAAGMADNRTAGPDEHGRMTWTYPGSGSGASVAAPGRVLREIDPSPVILALIHRVGTVYKLPRLVEAGRKLATIGSADDLHAYLRSQA